MQVFTQAHPGALSSIHYIDAEALDSSYARYADDSMYDGTENAVFETRGSGPTARIVLVATETIAKGIPVRTAYGWQYWFQPQFFSKDLML